MQNDSEALQQFLSGRKTLMQRAADLLVSGRSSKKAHNNTSEDMHYKLHAKLEWFLTPNHAL